MLLSEFERPRTILIKQQQQQHIFYIKKLKKNYPRHGTLDPRPLTLDKKIDSLTADCHMAYLKEGTGKGKWPRDFNALGKCLL